MVSFSNSAYIPMDKITCDIINTQLQPQIRAYLRNIFKINYDEELNIAAFKSYGLFSIEQTTTHIIITVPLLLKNYGIFLIDKRTGHFIEEYTDNDIITPQLLSAEISRRNGQE